MASEHAAETPPAAGHRPHGFTFRAAQAIGKRVYALVLIGVVLYPSWLAIQYLVRSLILTSPPPAQVIDLPKRMDEGLLQKQRSAFAGVQAAENSRSPLAHYHLTEGWFQPDTFNDCARSGCHAPLPHSKHKELRAFLNMHATSLHCGVCHMQTDATPLSLTWYDLATGHASGPPALLAAYDWLAAHETAQSRSELSQADQQQIVDLLRAAARAAGNEPVLEQLAAHLAAVRVTSTEFGQIVDVARATLPQYFRGEYGAKLAQLEPDGGRPHLAHPQDAAAVRAWLDRPPRLAAEKEKQMLAAVHPHLRQPALVCTACHRAEGSLIDFAKLGYPAARIRALMAPTIFEMIEHIGKGELFYLPGFMGTSAPAGEER